jgi:hypothetical protein
MAQRLPHPPDRDVEQHLSLTQKRGQRKLCRIGNQPCPRKLLTLCLRASAGQIVQRQIVRIAEECGTNVTPFVLFIGLPCEQRAYIVGFPQGAVDRLANVPPNFGLHEFVAEPVPSHSQQVPWEPASDRTRYYPLLPARFHHLTATNVDSHVMPPCIVKTIPISCLYSSDHAREFSGWLRIPGISAEQQQVADPKIPIVHSSIALPAASGRIEDHEIHPCLCPHRSYKREIDDEAAFDPNPNGIAQGQFANSRGAQQLS